MNPSIKPRPDEQQLLDDMVKLEGQALSEEEENLIIDQAVFIGELPDPAKDAA